MTETQPRDPSEMSGWLYKLNPFSYQKKRWVVLSNGVLSYYKTPTEVTQKCKGSFPLEGALVHATKSNIFVVNYGNAPTLRLKAANENERDIWVNAIKLTKSKAARQNIPEKDQIHVEKEEKRDKSEVRKPLNAALGYLQTYGNRMKKQIKLMNSSIATAVSAAPKNGVESPGKGKNRKKSDRDCAVFDEDLIRRGQKQISKEEVLNLPVLEEQLPRQLLTFENAKQSSLLTNGENDSYNMQNTVMSAAAICTACQLLNLNQATNLPTSLSTDDDDAFFDASSLSDNDMFYDALDDTASSDQVLLDDGRMSSETSCVSQTLEVSDADGIDGTLRRRNEEEVTMQSVNSELSESPVDISVVSNESVLDTISPTRIAKKQKRTRIPDKPNRPRDLGSILKNCIGTDLTTINMPLSFSEPLSMLQRIAEEYEYSAILDKAAHCADSCEQLAYVAAFIVSGYANSNLRATKPFNPLLGETYEFDRTHDLGWRCISEQVSNYPSMAAQHCESKDWVCYQEFGFSLGFRGTYIQMKPSGISHLRFHSSGNHYSWRKVVSNVHLSLPAKLWVDNQGKMEIVNHKTGDKCILEFKPYSCFGSVNRKVTGYIKNHTGNVVWELGGTWDYEMKASKVDEKQAPPVTLWSRRPLPQGAERYYNFSEFACQLNEIEEGVAPTDSRLRRHQRLMEEGNWDAAEEAKLRLADKERRRKKEEDAKKAAKTRSYPLQASLVRSGKGQSYQLLNPYLQSERNEVLSIVWSWSDQEEVTERVHSLALNGKNCAQILSFACELSLKPPDIKRLLDRVSILLSSFSPLDVPAVAYQLLQLCRSHHPFQVIELLRGYFSKAFHQNEGPQIGSKEYQELCNCRGMVIFHINRMGVSSDHPIVRDLLAYMKANLARPSVVLDLFTLEVILAVSSGTLMRSQIIDTLRTLIVRAVSNEQVKQDSAWLADVLKEAVDVKQLFTDLIETCIHEKEILITGVEYLGFALLEYKPSKSQSAATAKAVHMLGAKILAKMSRKTPPAIKSVMNALLAHLSQSNGEEQYIDTLSLLCIEVPMLLQLSHLQQILQIAVCLPVDSGRLTLSSLYPVMRLNKQFRDSVLMNMRKSLSGRSVAYRQIAVAGLMQMLKFAKGLGPISSTQASFFSQTQSFNGSFMEYHSLNATQGRNQDLLYAELFLLFKRCLDQAAFPVKVDVYQGFTDVIVRNQNLLEPTMELLYDHLDQFIRPILNHTGIKIDECFDKDKSEPTVKEPLCFLLQTCVHLATSSSSQDDIESLREKLSSTLDALSSFLVDWDLGDWDLNESSDLNPTTVEGRFNILKVKFIMSLHVPLMEFCVLTGALTLRIKAEVLLTLFRKYKRLNDYLKEMQDKLKKKEKGKKEKENEHGEEQKIAMQDYEGCIMSMKSVSSLMQGLFGSGSEGHPAALDLLRSQDNRDFQSYILEMVRKISLHLQKTGRPIRGEHSHGDKLIQNVCKTARSLLCLAIRPAVFSEGDLTQRVLALQSLGSFAVYMHDTHPLKLVNYFVGIEGEDEITMEIELPEQIMVTVQRLQKLGERLIAAGGDGDVHPLKALISLFELLTTISHFLPPGSDQVKTLHIWYEKISKDWDITDGPVTRHALTGLVRSQIQLKSNPIIIPELAKQIHAHFGDVDDTATLGHSGEIWGIVKECPRALLPCVVVEQIELLLEHVTFVIGLVANADGDYADKLDKGICARLSLCVVSLNELAQTKLPEGAGTDAVLKGLNKFFVCISLYAKKHKGTVTDRFEKLVRDIGQRLTQYIYDLFMFLENRSRESSAKRKKGRQFVAQKEKIIRDARPIATLSGSIEEAVKELMKLGKKVKVDLGGMIKLATARDFRIRTAQLESDSESENDEDPSLADAPQSTPLPSANRRKKRRSDENEGDVNE